MGIVLGLTLGAIGFLRGVLTPEDVLGNLEKRHQDFQIRVPQADRGLVETKEEPAGWFHPKRMRVSFPKHCEDVSITENKIQVILPEAGKFDEAPVNARGQVEFRFPAKSEIRSEAVSRFSLAMVIAQAVAIICLWGTLVGSMLPLVFRRLGVDPGVASSPFVATFVDVTGIVIYFTIASVWLL